MQHITCFNREHLLGQEKFSPAYFPAWFVCYPVFHTAQLLNNTTSTVVQEVNKLVKSPEETAAFHTPGPSLFTLRRKPLALGISVFIFSSQILWMYNCQHQNQTQVSESWFQGHQTQCDVMYVAESLLVLDQLINKTHIYVHSLLNFYSISRMVFKYSFTGLFLLQILLI